MKDKAKKKKEAQMDAVLVVDIVIVPTETILPTLVPGPSCLSSAAPSMTPSSSTIPCLPGLVLVLCLSTSTHPGCDTTNEANIPFF